MRPWGAVVVVIESSLRRENRRRIFDRIGWLRGGLWRSGGGKRRGGRLDGSVEWRRM